MFTIFSNFFGKAVQGVGTIFVSIGLMLSGAPATTETNAQIEIVPSAELHDEQEEQSTPETKPVSQSQRATKVIAAVISPSSSKTAETNLEITNINIATDTEGAAANFTWKSTIPTRSRVSLEGDVYDSEEGLSLEHSVTISGLSDGESYDYIISARTQGDPQLEDDVHGTYIPLANGRTHTVFIQGGLDDDCQDIVVIDSSSRVAANIPLEIATYTVSKSGARFSSGSKLYTSDRSGVIEVCDLMPTASEIKYKIYSKQTGSVTI